MTDRTPAAPSPLGGPPPDPAPGVRSSPCGCSAAPDPSSGVLRRVARCDHHAAMRRDPATLGEEYYRELGALDADAPARYVGELEEALGAITRPKGDGAGASALEIGCGASPYVAAIRAAGHAYFGIDPSPWAEDWMARRWGAWCDRARLEDVRGPGDYSLILAAHALEHLPDAPAAIRKCADLLRPGGELWVVVPDDSDPCNPDHDWFWTAETLRGCVEAAGLEVVREATRKYVPHESFLYCRARKPA